MRSALLVPCYKAKRFLPRLREQVDRLAPAFDEVLLADDCSNDGTAELAESMGFTILRLAKNRGPGGARNALAEASRADWIHFHDVDDELAPDYFARVLPLATALSDVVFHFEDFIDEVTRSPMMRWGFEPAELLADPAKHLLAHPMPTSATFVRRETFLKLGGFDEQHRCFEDGDFHFRLGLAGARIACLPETLVWSLRHSEGAGSNERYCFECRLDYLESYVSRVPAHLRPTLGVEAERTATMLLRHGNRPAAERAIALCGRLGHAVPATSNPLVRLLRGVVPAARLIRWQDRHRQKLQASQ